MNATFTSDFAGLIETNKGLIYKVAISYCQDEEDRRDLVQEIIIQLWISFAKYREEYKLSTWMYRVALNVAISHYRKDKQRRESNSPFIESLMDFQDQPDDAALSENILLLQRFITELKALDKALMLLYLENRSYREIAEVLRISESNVATKVGRIKDKLKQRFTLNNE